MGLTVILEDEDGRAIQTLPHMLELHELKFQERGSFRLLKYVDSYGDTTFNALQLDDLLKDFEQLRLRLVSQAVTIELIIRLIKESQDRVHTYIKFYGD